jgi:hypothetical protein
LSNKSKEELQEMKSDAIDAEDFGLAERIKTEINSRKSVFEFQKEYQSQLNLALDIENYDDASLIKERLELCEELIKSDSLMQIAIENEDYKKAQKLKDEKEKGLKILSSPLEKVSINSQNEDGLTKNTGKIKNEKEDLSTELFIETQYMGDLFINNEYVTTTTFQEGTRVIVVPGTHRVRYGGTEKEFTFVEGSDYIIQPQGNTRLRYKLFSSEITIKGFDFDIVNLNEVGLSKAKTEYSEANMKDEFEFEPNSKFPFTYATISLNPIQAGMGRAAAFRITSEGSFSPKIGLYGGIFAGTVGNFYHDYYTFYFGPTFMFRSNRKHFNMGVGFEFPYTYSIDGDFGPYSRGIQLDLGEGGFEIGANLKLACEYYFGGNVGISLTGLIGTNGIPEAQLGVVFREISIKRIEYREYLFD